MQWNIDTTTTNDLATTRICQFVCRYGVDAHVTPSCPASSCIDVGCYKCLPWKKTAAEEGFLQWINYRPLKLLQNESTFFSRFAWICCVTLSWYPNPNPRWWRSNILLRIRITRSILLSQSRIRPSSFYVCRPIVCLSNNGKRCQHSHVQQPWMWKCNKSLRFRNRWPKSL